MKKQIGFILGILILVIAGALYFSDSPEHTGQVQAASYYGTDVMIPDFPEVGTKGTDTNPFVLLEIVPYEGYAEIGYMISGCEPIPLDKLAFDDTAEGLIPSIGGMTVERKIETTRTLPEGDTVGPGQGQWKYDPGSGEYSRVRFDFTSKHSFLKHALGVPEDQINDYKIHVITITPDRLNIPSNHRLIDRADLIYLTPKYHCGDGVVALWEKMFPDKVITNEPTSLYSNDITWDTAVKILEKAVVDEDPAPVIFDTTTFSDDRSYMANIKPEKYFGNGTRVDDAGATGYSSNAAKLYLVMQQMDPGKFYREYIATGKVVAAPVKNAAGSPIVTQGVTMTTGFYKDLANGTSVEYIKGSAEDAAVWNIHTFLPYSLFQDNAALEGNKALERLGYKIFTYDGYLSHFSIRHRLYAYNGDNAITQIFLHAGINESYYNKEAFDYFQELNGGVRPSALTPAQAIYYLLHTTKGYSKEKLHILELEPCNDFLWDGTGQVWDTCKTPEQDGYNGSAYARLYFSNLLSSYTGKVQITTMTTSEFIGRIEDLNSTYDMIYIGLRDGMLRKNAGGITQYNDSSLNGKVYLHVGDKVRASSELRGALGPGDIGDIYRYAGNDITGVKREQLEKYMTAGFPVVFGEGFFNSDGTRNSYKVDASSQIYQLMGFSSNSLFQMDALNTGLLKQKLFAPKCQLIFGKMDGSLSEEQCYPILYKDKTKNPSLSDRDIYINGEVSSNRTLSYHFYIKDNSGEDRTYRIGLYIDINADGKYDTLTEEISNISIQDKDGYEVSPGNLKAEMDYTLVTELEDTYLGVLPWELQIKDIAMPDNHYKVSKISALKVPEEDKIHINVLQIMADTDNNLKLEDHTLFKHYTEELNDYVLHFKSITVSQFKSLCGTGPYTYHLEDIDEPRNDIKNASGVYIWDDYDGDRKFDVDMLILGFADCYTDIDNENALNNIKQYINQGKTVLFTHDTTSFFNQPKESYSGTETYWGYHLNRNFREAFGMDRFGVASYSSVAERLAAGKDYAPDGYIQGYSDLTLNRFAMTGQYFSHVNFPASRTFTDEYVTKVNHGQLTMYPYEIDDSFKVATTHGQYYQLDMEKDDIVVWYCLSDDSMDAGGKANGIYSTTPNDVRNNYYIYSKGNITYSGVGHSAISQSLSNPGAVMETKLFVNTIIAAYSSAAKEPVINITNRNKSIDSTGMNYVYVDYDLYATNEAYGAELTGTGQKIKFRVTENNVLYNKKLTVEYFDVNPETGALSLMTLATKKEGTGETVTEIIGGEEYYVEVPLGDLNYKNKGPTTVIRVTMTYGISSEYNLRTEKSVTLIRRGLFDLD